ncbi:uncharacterized protein [Physcomitrium patens]|uniref:uncharacterized protein n=1 Tax=Physcomitrium patens TaxID=3218 RepID=UPI003CCDB0AA
MDRLPVWVSGSLSSCNRCPLSLRDSLVAFSFRAPAPETDLIGSGKPVETEEEETKQAADADDEEGQAGWHSTRSGRSWETPAVLSGFGARNTASFLPIALEAGHWTAAVEIILWQLVALQRWRNKQVFILFVEVY